MQIISNVSTLDSESLTKEIFRINNLYALASPALYKEHLLIQSKFDLLLTMKTQKLLFPAKQLFFGTGDKTGRLAYHTIQNDPYDQICADW